MKSLVTGNMPPSASSTRESKDDGTVQDYSHHVLYEYSGTPEETKSYPQNDACYVKLGYV